MYLFLSRLHIMSGKASPDCPASESTLVANLRSSIELLKEADIVGLIEPINNFSVPGYFLNNFDVGEACTGRDVNPRSFCSSK